MFTGLIEELGSIENIEIGGESAALTVNATKVLEGTVPGDSIAVNGVCLTVTRMGNKLFTVDVMAETLQKTGLQELKPMSRVNLERALRLSSRLGGHLVSGHVDGVGTVRSVKQVGIAKVYSIQTTPAIMHYLIPKGSVAVDGISLTVVETGTDYFTISIIPHTFQNTTLYDKKAGSRVNLETDLIGKYVAKFLKTDEPPDQRGSQGITLEQLSRFGFI
ncbi:riboflavin synthase, alpha subunit [Syntrophobotulus glycolicus DSM 8271]|uniref:Riboflavin synthase n=1 Tax=Syntrophobotulus glycolicus (strain DSM 8271 / FlGlyR) TaxID=645991 RepID=F0SZL0_SYNGF|nr:riboflavin synthase [Syntrophobotulus glycolicus]ADY56096.1 riboflavin synthase, alpha subunit [Syntrophobotulus glycolicus DSM 8271]